METVLNQQHPFVTVIVPTYRDWRRLGICLNALELQSYPAEHFEIIVTNNDPADPKPKDFRLPANCRVIDVAKPGSYAARNAGLRQAKGAVIGFTDADCIPHQDWIRNAIEHFKANPDCSRIAGHISIFYENGTPTAAELYNTIYSFPQEMHVRDAGTSVTGNLFTYKEVFEKVGFFDEKQLSLGDLVWGRKAKRKGFRIDYVASVLVQHPARSFRELVKKERRVGGGKAVRQTGDNKAIRNFVELLNGCRPRMSEVKFIFKNGSQLRFTQKCKVVLMRHYLLNVRTYEQLRVSLGKAPNRS